MSPTHDPKRKTGPFTARYQMTRAGYFTRLKTNPDVVVEHIDYEPETVLTLTLLDPDSFDLVGYGLEFIEEVSLTRAQ